MTKKLKERLEERVEWLLDENIRYSKKDFEYDWKHFQSVIEDSSFLELISIKTYSECKNVLLKYIDYFLG